jgi:murein DD-endopeptidase MepM/ murein hydrolase activator NlpD
MRDRLLAVLLLVPVLAFAPVAAGAESPADPAGPAASSGPVAAVWGPPLDGELTVTRPFEPLTHPFAAGHRGADLRGTPWSTVLAAGDGVVAFAGWVAGRPVVSVDHAGGLRTTYEPVDPSVAAGQPVTRGSPIGTLAVGHAGCPAEACLHWGLRRGEMYLDPLLLLGPPRVRLLPIE